MIPTDFDFASIEQRALESLSGINALYRDDLTLRLKRRLARLGRLRQLDAPAVITDNELTLVAEALEGWLRVHRHQSVGVGLAHSLHIRVRVDDQLVGIIRTFRPGDVIVAPSVRVWRAAVRWMGVNAPHIAGLHVVREDRYWAKAHVGGRTLLANQVVWDA